MDEAERIETCEQYEIIKEGVIQGLSPTERAQYLKLKEALRFREGKKIEADKEKSWSQNKKLTYAEYHQSYDDVREMDKQIGLLGIAKDFAKTQAIKAKEQMNRRSWVLSG